MKRIAMAALLALVATAAHSQEDDSSTSPSAILPDVANQAIVGSTLQMANSMALGVLRAQSNIIEELQDITEGLRQDLERNTKALARLEIVALITRLAGAILGVLWFGSRWIGGFVWRRKLMSR